jgi:hypothetical protein
VAWLKVMKSIIPLYLFNLNVAVKGAPECLIFTPAAWLFLMVCKQKTVGESG